MKYLLTITAIVFLSTSHALAFDHSHADFSKLLQTHVTMSADKTSSTVDYKNFNKASLDAYLKMISKVSNKEFKTFSKNQKLAFLINAYNAFTIKLILNNYPVKSIKDTGERSFSNPLKNPWKMKFFKLLGKKRGLDEVEHDLTRANDEINKDPRIHFAFNCASIGCPALLNTAWEASKIENQFDQAAKGFLKDRTRNRFNATKGRVELNNIFKWYKDDFNKGKYGSLKKFLAQYVDAIADNEKERTQVLSKSYSVTYTGYDWNLNYTK